MVKEVEAPFLKVHIKWPDGNKRYTIMVPAAAPLSDLHEIAKMYLQVLAPLRSKYTREFIGVPAQYIYSPF